MRINNLLILLCCFFPEETARGNMRDTHRLLVLPVLLAVLALHSVKNLDVMKKFERKHPLANNWIIYPPDLPGCARIPETNRVRERSSTLPLRAVGIEPGHTAARMDGRQVQNEMHNASTQANTSSKVSWIVVNP
jgi:hypothetical protein